MEGQKDMETKEVKERKRGYGIKCKKERLWKGTENGSKETIGKRKEEETRENTSKSKADSQIRKKGSS